MFVWGLFKFCSFLLVGQLETINCLASNHKCRCEMPGRRLGMHVSFSVCPLSPPPGPGTAAIHFRSLITVVIMELTRMHL